MASRETATEELDRAFDSLRHPYRRRVLALLNDGDPGAEVEVAAVEAASGPADRERLATELYHTHLPRLDAAGYVEWDSEARTVRRGARFSELSPLLRVVENHRDDLPGEWP